MKFEPVTAVRAYERVVEQVEHAVLTGRLVPGERLPSERELMTQFGVSRSTVREALRVLQAGGVVRSRPGDPRGPEVLAPSPATLRKSIHRLARAEHMGLAELLQFRMLLEGSAYLLAAHLRTAEQLERMTDALEAMRRHVDGGEGDDAAFGEADLAFHDAVAHATQNPLVVACAEVVRDVALELIEDKLAHADDRRAVKRKTVAHHAEMLAAVRDGEGERACLLARRALHDYYAEYVPAERRAMLEPFLGSP
ncbi:FadR/GntR family transcriptional regulator [Prauserella muralis]|uniref:GntR family transcriptional regulator n=1 Tax=Prauserella muralis TaxID=588067 RepID=A0A2V4B923_9PSEU|nr:FadR/GntR family transcriptional regulator [Prauserella muralis]PXY31740.1 GntR family transcriptional regulator [Prauserella muralis]